MKNKKAVEIHFLIMLVIGIIVFVVLAIMMPDLLRKGGEDTEGFFDEDSDGVINSLDKCACDFGEKENNGCPPGKDGYTDEETKKCKEQIERSTRSSMIIVTRGITRFHSPLVR